MTRLCREVLGQVERAVVGKRAALELVLAAVLAGGHVLLQDSPGLGKTLAARAFAQALGLPFRRVQFTPDLLPADVTGSFVWDQRAAEFQFRPGPLFAGLVLGDEINRTPPKTQAALLEAMQEGQVTVEGTTFPLDRPFHVIATANPIEYEGTYPLPEAQLDRFLLRVSFDYPSVDDEVRVLTNRIGRGREEIEIDQVTDSSGLARAQRTVERVAVDETVRRYCVDLTRATRTHAPGAARRLTAGLARAVADRAGACSDRRTRLCRPGGREGGRGRCAGAPHHAAPGDVDARGVGRRPGQRGARPRAGAQSRRRDPPVDVTGRWHPSVALLSAAGSVAALLFLAVAMHRPDLVVLAAPLLTGLVVNLVRRREGDLRATLQAAAPSTCSRIRARCCGCRSPRRPAPR